jgi:5-methyltetrahydropteroyltriglutamate--homocysteine methyltransferase
LRQRRARLPSASWIDIKTHYIETPDDIIERAYLPGLRDPERPEISTDCGPRRVLAT